MKLCEFGEERQVDIAAKAMSLIFRMKYNEKTQEYYKTVMKPKAKKKDKDNEAIHVYDLFCEMLKNEPKATMELFALINDKKPEEYKPTVAELTKEMMNAFFDDDLMALFDLRVQTPTEASSGLATENTEA